MKSEATDLVIPITDSYNSKSYYMSSQSLDKEGAFQANKSGNQQIFIFIFIIKI